MKGFAVAGIERATGLGKYQLNGETDSGRIELNECDVPRPPEGGWPPPEDVSDMTGKAFSSS